MLPQSISNISLFPVFDVHRRRQIVVKHTICGKEKLMRVVSDITASEVIFSLQHHRSKAFRSKRKHQHSNCRFEVDQGCSPTLLCCWGLWHLLLQVNLQLQLFTFLVVFFRASVDLDMNLKFGIR